MVGILEKPFVATFVMFRVVFSFHFLFWVKFSGFLHIACELAFDSSLSKTYMINFGWG